MDLIVLHFSKLQEENCSLNLKSVTLGPSTFLKQGMKMMRIQVVLTLLVSTAVLLERSATWTIDEARQSPLLTPRALHALPIREDLVLGEHVHDGFVSSAKEVLEAAAPFGLLPTMTRSGRSGNTNILHGIVLFRLDGSRALECFAELTFLRHVCVWLLLQFWSHGHEDPIGPKVGN